MVRVISNMKKTNGFLSILLVIAALLNMSSAFNSNEKAKIYDLFLERETQRAASREAFFKGLPIMYFSTSTDEVMDSEKPISFHAKVIGAAFTAKGFDASKPDIYYRYSERPHDMNGETLIIDDTSGKFVVKTCDFNHRCKTLK